MAGLQFPNIGGNALSGFAMGRDMRAQDDAAKRAQQTNMLAGQAYNARGADRDAALGQLAAVDPGAAVEFGGQLQGQEDKRLTKLYGAARYLEQARQSKNPQMVEGAWAAVRPYLQREFPEGQFSEQWDDAAMAPILYQTLAMGAGGGTSGAVQSTKVGEDGFYYTVDRAGNWVNSGIRADPGATRQTISVTGPDGRTRQYTFDKRSGGYVPAQLGAPAAAGGSAPTITAAPGDELVSFLRQDLGREPTQAELASARDGNLSINAPPAATSPFVSRAPEEQAAATTLAQERAKLSVLPEQQVIEVQGAAAKAAAEARAKGQVERELSEPARLEKVRQITTKIDAANAAVDKAMGQIDWTTTGFLGSRLSNVPGTPAYDLRATGNTIKANLAFDTLQQMREASPTGGALGAVSERELALLESAVASIDQAQSQGQLRDALTAVKTHYANWLEAVSNADRAARTRVQGESAPAVGGSQNIDTLLEKYR